MAAPLYDRGRTKVVRRVVYERRCSGGPCAQSKALREVYGARDGICCRKRADAAVPQTMQKSQGWTMILLLEVMERAESVGGVCGGPKRDVGAAVLHS
jgi:hypothetical protein